MEFDQDCNYNHHPNYSQDENIETQGKIVKLNSLIDKEQNLLNNLQQKRTLLIRSVCLKAAKKNIDNK